MCSEMVGRGDAACVEENTSSLSPAAACIAMSALFGSSNRVAMRERRGSRSRSVMKLWACTASSPIHLHLYTVRRTTLYSHNGCKNGSRKHQPFAQANVTRSTRAASSLIARQAEEDISTVAVACNVGDRVSVPVPIKVNRVLFVNRREPSLSRISVQSQCFPQLPL